MQIRLPFHLRIAVALRGIGLVLRRPRYIFLAVMASVIFYELIFWFNNWPMLRYVLTVPTLSTGDKLQFIAATYTNLWQSAASPLAVGLIALSILQGIIISCLIFAMRRQPARRPVMGTAGISGLAAVLGTLGLGCAACGTSLVTPILLWLFSSSSVALADTVGLGVVVAGLCASVYALFTVGIRAAMADSFVNKV